MRLNHILWAFAVLAASGAVAAPAQANQAAQAASVQTAEGHGVVTAVNVKAGSITIKHEPIASLKWPAMTMTFKVKSADLLAGIGVGQKVEFELTSDNGKPVVTKLAPRI